MEFNLKKWLKRVIIPNKTDASENKIESQDDKSGLLEKANVKLLLQPPDGLINHANLEALLEAQQYVSKMRQAYQENETDTNTSDNNNSKGYQKTKRK